MNIVEYMKETINIKKYPHVGDDYTSQENRPRVICNDGAMLSVQASRFHYCTPRENGLNYYSMVEVGFPTVTPPKSWHKYAEIIDEETELTDCIYPYIPIVLVQEFIDVHGGIDVEKSLGKGQ